jgi:hypothetical protein
LLNADNKEIVSVDGNNIKTASFSYNANEKKCIYKDNIIINDGNNFLINDIGVTKNQSNNSVLKLKKYSYEHSLEESSELYIPIDFTFEHHGAPWGEADYGPI